MRYRTVIGPADRIDEDVNALAEKGWIVQQAFVTGAIDIETDDPDRPMEIPIIAYLMYLSEPEQAPEVPDRPVRNFIGRGSM